MPRFRLSLNTILLVAMVSIFGPGVVQTLDQANRVIGSSVTHYQTLSAQGRAYTPNVYRY